MPSDAPIPVVQSRAVRRSRRATRWLAPLAVVALVLMATLSCIIRLAWIHDAVHPAGNTFTYITLEKGTLSLWRHHNTVQSSPVSTTRNVINRQIEIGFVPQMGYAYRPGAYLDITIPLAPIAIGLAAIIITLTVVSRRRARIRAGHCECGYATSGLPAAQCPECGRSLPRVSPPPVS